MKYEKWKTKGETEIEDNDEEESNSDLCDSLLARQSCITGTHYRFDELQVKVTEVVQEERVQSAGDGAECILGELEVALLDSRIEAREDVAVPIERGA